jgi:hypothetical protein
MRRNPPAGGRAIYLDDDENFYGELHVTKKQ